MSKINKILVPVDGSDNACKAVDQAISLAEKAGASLEFVYVSSHINEHIPSDIIFDRIWEKLPKDITATKHVETGSRPKAIIRVARKLIPILSSWVAVVLVSSKELSLVA